MSLFSNMTTNGLEEQKDVLGGFSLLDTNIYPAVIKVAYAGKSQSGAMSITLHAEIEGKEYRETVYITNKNGENFYVNKTDGKKNPLAGFSIINDICQIALNKPLNQVDTEDKILMIYNNELGKEIATKVPCIMELKDKKVDLAIVKEKRFKMVNDNGNFHETDETREANVITKVFDPDSHQTVYEIKHGLTEEPLFCDKWLEKNRGQVIDRTRKGRAEKPTATAPKQERKSLFA